MKVFFLKKIGRILPGDKGLLLKECYINDVKDEYIHKIVVLIYEAEVDGAPCLQSVPSGYA